MSIPIGYYPFYCVTYVKIHYKLVFLNAKVAFLLETAKCFA